MILQRQVRNREIDADQQSTGKMNQLLSRLTIGSAQQQVCSAEEASRIDGFMQRSYIAGYQFATTGDPSILAAVKRDSDSVTDSLSATCRIYLERWSASVKMGAQRSPRRIGGPGGVQYDRGTDTYIAPGVTCSPRGCTAN